MTDKEIEAVAAEPLTIRNKRAVLVDRVAKLKEGQEVFKTVMAGGGATAALFSRDVSDAPIL
jgi:hypothetical protein